MSFSSISNSSEAEIDGEKSKTTDSAFHTYIIQLSTSKSTENVEEIEDKSILFIVIGFSALVAVLLVLVVFGIVLLRKRLRINQDLKKITDPRHKPSCDDYAALVSLTQYLLNKESRAKRFLEIKVGDVDDDKRLIAEGATIALPTCRYSKIHCLRETQINVVIKEKTHHLHMNDVFDFYNRPMYICQAPLPEEFNIFWMAIVTQKIGVIVWLGEIEKGNKNKLEAYIPMKEATSAKYGHFLIENLCNVVVNDFALYFVKVRLERRSFFQRRLVFVHSIWPSKFLPKDPQKLCNIVAIVHSYHEHQRKRDLSGIVVHNVAGVNRSPSFCAVYIGRQIWMARNRINLPALLKYIRSRRFGAFTTNPDSFRQMQIIYYVLETFVKISSKFVVRKSSGYAKFEQDLQKQNEVLMQMFLTRRRVKHPAEGDKKWLDEYYTASEKEMIGGTPISAKSLEEV